MKCWCGCPPPMGRRALLAGAALAASLPRRAKASAPPDPALIQDLVAANRILADQGILDGFGHVSARHDKDPARYLLSRSMAPGLVTADDILEYDLDSNAIDPRGRASYLERFIHGAIYKARPDVMAVVHSHSPAVLPFADTGVKLRPMNHIAGFLGGGPPVFEIRGTAGPGSDMLIRTADLGHALAAALGHDQVVLMRGHGSAIAAQSIRHVVYRAIYTEANARSELQALSIGKPAFLNEQEAKASMITNDGIVGRPWELWKKQAMAK